MLTGRYEISLVIISILVAILASYTALSLAGRIAQSRGSSRWWWIGGGALAMGVGIWSMHFIGMLAFRLPVKIGYDFWITLLSLLLPIVVSAMALWQVSQPELPFKRVVSGGILMGIGINGMHYTGMAGMRMQPGILYDPWLFAASVLIAISASSAALWVAFRLKRNVPKVWLPRLGAAVIMGFAIVGMHYTGMAAAAFPAGSICLAATDGLNQDWLAIMVVMGTLAVLAIALLTSVYDARLEARTQILALSQATAEERQILLTRERAARTQAEHMSAVKDEFLATLSHELRTPLNSILGWAQILRRGVKDEATLHKGLETIERNARAQAQLIDDLLDMSRIISGKIRLEMQPVDPVSFMESALETVRPAAITKNINLEKMIDPDIGLISGDISRLQQVMWNLLSNAVKFTPNGGTINIMLKREDNLVQIAVTDSGMGINPDFLPYVFDRFRQADASTTRKFGGLGLGLSIVKNLVELHGGSIQAKSHGEGMGASFIVLLPSMEKQVHHSGRSKGSSKSFLGASIDFTPLDLSGIAVLAVDDEPDSLELVRQLLLACNATVFTAVNPKLGLSIFTEKQPDIVISDIAMPDMDGYEFIKHLRAKDAEKGTYTPVIALSAFTRSEDRQRALSVGFTDYLHKPIEPSNLVKQIAGIAGHFKLDDPKVLPADS